jgi:hypothetical protein
LTLEVLYDRGTKILRLLSLKQQTAACKHAKYRMSIKLQVFTVMRSYIVAFWDMTSCSLVRRVIPQAVSRWLPTAEARVRARSGHVGFVVDKVHWGRFSPSTSVSPASHYSTKFSILIITQGRHNRPIDGRRAEWTQLDSTPHYSNLKK